MTDEDRTANKLKGHNCLIKFRDGEELTLHIPDLDNNGDDIQWFADAEQFINGCGRDVVEYFPARGLAITQDSVKYIRKI
jgi:hypothetical protein